MAGLLAATCLCGVRARANPNGAVVSQGSASFTSHGSQLTINTSDRAFINWRSFNIGAGETTTFVQPSASSVVWNQINDPNPSQILGNLNANGYVILQNQSGFYVGGQAAINAHGLIMTTAPAFTPDLSSGGPWDFNAPPPSARILNYGQINGSSGGSVFLIANDIENNGSITAPGGNIGLYAGKQVLVSERPDGLGLSAQVTLPQGSVDNTGKLIADAGTIAVHAQVVNQGGLIQANSMREVNGAIELVAGDSLNIGPQSVISAKGDITGTSAGGNVTLQSGGTYQDSPTSTINVSGGAQGGNGGQIEISAAQFNSISSIIDGQAAAGSVAGRLTIDPPNILLVSGSGDNAPASGIVNPGDPPSAGSADTLTLNVDTFNTLISQNMLSQINLQATQDIELDAFWSLPTGQGLPGPGDLPGSSLTLQAGRNITLENGAAIQAGQNWTVNLNAGGAFMPTVAQPTPAPGTYGVYLNGNSYIQTQNGDINVSAMNEVQIAVAPPSPASPDVLGNNGIRTIGDGIRGGNISVITTYGDVNTGGNPQGYLYQSTAPYYTASPNVGGISTAAGGNVTINAGGNVFSFLPGTGGYSALETAEDGGTGAFGPEAGNVSITAGGSIFGHYVLANGTGTITAQTGDVGSLTGNPFALSLIKGTWNIDAPNGTIYLQEVRNPNGDFNNKQVSGLHHPASPGKYLFTYDPAAAVDLTAVGVYLNGEGVPRPFGDQIPILYPPQLEINAGSGGVVLQNSVTLFPSPDANLSIVTTGGGSLTSLTSVAGLIPQLLMSDSGQTQWSGATTFTATDHGPLNISDDTPVNINISGDMKDLTLITTKQTQINVTGDMINCGFSGQNVKAGDKTSITVGGQIFNPSAYSFVFLNAAIPAIAANDLPLGSVDSWSEIFNLALDPVALANFTVPPGTLPSALAGLAFTTAGVFTTFPNSINANPGFVYNAATGRLGFVGNMLTTTAPGVQTTPLVQALTQPMVVLRYGPDGNPIVDASGHLVTDTVAWVPAPQIQTLAQASMNTVPIATGQLGYRIGGPGEFDVTANSISLGNSYGILSCGVFDPQGGFSRYGNLAGVFQSGGASVTVNVTGDLDMLTSTIATLGGGDVNVTSTGGAMDLGSQELFGTQRQVGFGVFSGGPGDVTVTAHGDIDVDGSRIAAYDGGNIVVESTDGNVNAGSGGATITGVTVSFVNPATGQAGFYAEDVFGSGIVANTLVNPGSVPNSASQPGNITVTTPKGDINADQGGILQEALNGNVAAGPVINLTAGSAGFPGNINLGNSGVIGGTVNLNANGDITGLVVSRQNSSIQAAQNASVTVLSGGQANVSATGTVSGTIIAVGGVNATGGGGVTATLLSQNVSVGGGQSTSTLGTSAAASSAATAASAQANDTAQQQVGSNSSQEDDPFKKKGRGPLLARRVGRVTVILPKG